MSGTRPSAPERPAHPGDQGAGTAELFVSFTNQVASPSLLLALLAGEGDTLHWLSGSALGQFNSAVGMAHLSSWLCVLFKSTTGSALGVFDADHRLVRLSALDAVSDAHGLCSDGENLFATSTGTDEIVRIDLDRRSGRVRSASPCWVHPRSSGEGCDSVHLNSVAWAEGRLLVTAFGPRPAAGWAGADQGDVRDSSSGELLMGSLRQPHSVFTMNGEVLALESARGRLRGTKGTDVLLGGYLRGVTQTPDGLWIGRSARRTPHRPGTLDVEGEGPYVDACGLLLLDPTTFTVKRTIDLRPYGNEIFDLCPRATTTASRASGPAAGSALGGPSTPVPLGVRRRIEEIERFALRRNQQLLAARRELERARARCRQLEAQLLSMGAVPEPGVSGDVDESPAVRDLVLARIRSNMLYWRWRGRLLPLLRRFLR